MTTEDRTEEFLDLYKKTEDALEAKYRNSRRHYSSVIIEYIKDYESEPVREKLEVAREIRNLLTHTAKLDGEFVVEPSAPVLDSLREAYEHITRPPLAIDYATKPEHILKANLNQKVLRLMEVMEKNGYSHVPVLDSGEFFGVFSIGSIFKYMLKKGGKGITPETTIAELGAQLDIKEHLENYEFVPRDTTYAAVRRKFEHPNGKHKRLSVIFITEDGSPRRRLLGMLTPWDVLGQR